jgi:ComF family protein
MSPDPLWRRVADRLLDSLAPRTCPGCDRAGVFEGVFCAACLAHCEPPIHTTLGELTVQAASRYSGPVKSAIARLKYGGRADLGDPLGRWAASRLDLARTGEGQLVPVPLHPARTVERGFDQVTLVGRALSHRVHLLLTPSTLERTRRTPPQARLAATERPGNVADAFRVRRRARGPVWLLDDVLTTGATAMACAQALTATGADVRGVICLAISGWRRSETPAPSAESVDPSRARSRGAGGAPGDSPRLRGATARGAFTGPRRGAVSASGQCR